MKLTEKEFIKADGTVVKLTPEWISTKLGEVYELSCLDGNSRERLHYGYMTDELVSFLETTDEKGTPFFERVRLKDTSVHADAGFRGYTSNDMIDGHTVHIQIDDKVQTDL